MAKIDLFDSKTCTIIGLVINIALTAFKLMAGIMGLSYAMIADAIHSGSDSLATFIALLGIKLGEKPADEDHPYGHANAETIAAVFVSLLVFGTGLFLGASALNLIANRDFQTPATIALVAAIVSVFVKEAMFQYTIRVGRRNNSPAVIASAWDHRSDAYSSLAALVGIIGAKLAFVYLDPIAGMVIAMMIIKMSIDVLRSNVGILMHETPDPASMDSIRTVVCNINEVKAVGDIKVHRCGPVSNVDVKIAVDGDMTVREGHHIAGVVRSELKTKIQHVQDVMVHVNPYRKDDPQEESPCRIE